MPLLDRAALGLRVQFLNLDARGEFVQARLQPGAFLLQLQFFGGKLFEPDAVALLLQIERGDFVADARQILRRGEGLGLRLAQRFLPLAQVFLNRVQHPLFLLQRQAMLQKRIFRSGQPLHHHLQFTGRGVAAFLGLRDVRQRLGVLRREFAQAFLVELDPAFVPVGFAL